MHRIWLLALCFPLAGCNGPSLPAGPSMQQARPSLEQIVANDRWSLAEGMHDDKPLLIRFREELRARPDVTALPLLVRVVWDFDTDATGMPDGEAGDAMEVFENRLVDAVEPDRIAVLTAVVTHDGDREWLFYAADAAAFARRLTEMPQEPERYPIEISVERDPAWSALHDGILAGVSG